MNSRIFTLCLASIYSFFHIATIAKAEDGRLGIGVSYVASKWNSLSPQLKNGSMDLHFEMTSLLRSDWELGFNFDFLQGYSQSPQEENLNAFDIFLQARRFWDAGAVLPFVGMGIGFGAYRAWSQSAESGTSISFDKHASGYLFGLNPELGLRFPVGPRFHFDLRMAYLAFVNDTTAAKAGGLSAGIVLGFTRE